MLAPGGRFVQPTHLPEIHSEACMPLAWHPDIPASSSPISAFDSTRNGFIDRATNPFISNKPQDTAWWLETKFIDDAPTLFVKFAGTADEIDAAYETAQSMIDGGFDELTFDLNGCQEVGLDFLAVCVTINRRLRKISHGASGLALLNVGEQVRGPFERIGIDRLFSIEKTIEKPSAQSGPQELSHATLTAAEALLV
jgi:hypothetical protein